MLKKLITCLLPWSLRRRALNRWFGYRIAPTARIGMAWIFPDMLVMDEHSYIDHLTVAINLSRVELGAHATIGRGNWITGFPINTNSAHFRHQTNRQPSLSLGESAAITKNHHIDCTDQIRIGRFSTIAGYQTQLLTHSIDVFENRQNSAPIHIGDYTFVGTNSVVLGGATLPDRSVLGAKSLLNKEYHEEWMLYAGVPAKPVQGIPSSARYFTRAEGFVV
ncbi:acyltransferase [Spirosoma rhododendri]|uniref:Acyltransferase n=1 Tax=Spirosoma rhododendri TaxID=2728024 RepID=A0A7L5DPS7_9BACT|nr:acyltransferase [Spirosoma rhododendri]QJD80125.1 acyltransferase [Spirosoma rhododendri]